jgi:hypothetical protein
MRTWFPLVGGKYVRILLLHPPENMINSIHIGINRNKKEIIGTDRNRTENQRKQILCFTYI